MEQHSRSERKNEHANFSYFFPLNNERCITLWAPSRHATPTAQANASRTQRWIWKEHSAMLWMWVIQQHKKNGEIKRNWKIYLSFHLKVIWFSCSSYFIYANFHPPLTIFRVYSLHFPHIIVSYIHMYTYILSHAKRNDWTGELIVAHNTFT